jgi:5-hydroxyisourate hydrolase
MTITALKQLFSLFSILKEFIMFKKLLPLSTLLLTSMTFAQTNPLSVHVLNLESGLPSAQVMVILEKSTGEKWVKLNKQYTGTK